MLSFNLAGQATILLLLVILSGWSTNALAGVQSLQRQIVVDDDDAEEQLGVVDLGSSDLELTVDGGVNQFVGLRFTDIIVPAGETISRAYIQFTADRAGSSATVLSIQGEASANSPAPIH